MKPQVTLGTISDGRLYDLGDRVKADTDGCKNCSACCHGVGDFISLTPFDVHVLSKHLNMTFDELLVDAIECHESGKIEIPHLKMHGDKNKCFFLNESERCDIHGYRPSICRLFPLGRVYEAGDFKYFLLEDACVKPELTDILVEDWIGIKDYPENKAFIMAWHDILSALAFRVKFIYDDHTLKGLNAYLRHTFYDMALEDDVDFYEAFFERVPGAKNVLGIL